MDWARRDGDHAPAVRREELGEHRGEQGHALRGAPEPAVLPRGGGPAVQAGGGAHPARLPQLANLPAG